MKKIVTMLGLLTVIFISLSFSSAAQNSKKRKGPSGEVTSKLLAADKAVVIDIFFKSLDLQHYYLEFTQGQNKEVYGTLSISGDDLAAIKRGSAPTDATKLIYGWYWQMGLLYVIGKTRTGVDLETVLGKENAARLQAIITKYTGGSGN